MKDVLEGIGVSILVILAIMILTVVLWGIVSPFMYLECQNATKDIGLNSKWNFWAGCLVQENNKWIPLDNWRYLGEK